MRWYLGLSALFHAKGCNTQGLDRRLDSGHGGYRALDPYVVGSGRTASDADAACDFALLLGVGCSACPSDGVENCLSVSLTDIEATATGTELAVVEEAGEHPECEE